MIRTPVLAFLVALPLAGLAAASSTRDAAAQPAGLNDQQRHGRQVFAQSCGVCHLPPSLNARSYGPSLNKASANGDDEIMREYIVNGTPRMPAFKHYLNSSEVDAIIAYVRTVPTPAPAQAPRRGEE
jgi:mono/diheme cytochrome c family protein